MVRFGRVIFRWTVTLFVIAAIARCCEARELHKRRHSNNNDNNHDELDTSVGAGAGGFAQVRGTQFDLNGSPFLFNGFNSYWMMDVATEPADRGKVSSVFREASAAGLTVCRTWAFSDGGDRALQVSPGVYDERVFQVWSSVYIYASSL